MRLIDADDLYTVCKEVAENDCLTDGVAVEVFDIVCEAMANTKTIDAVEVVRCGECKYYIYQWKSDDEQVYGLCGIHGTADLKSTDFCSYGKRKEASECD